MLKPAPLTSWQFNKNESANAVADDIAKQAENVRYSRFNLFPCATLGRENRAVSTYSAPVLGRGLSVPGAIFRVQFRVRESGVLVLPKPAARRAGDQQCFPAYSASVSNSSSRST